MNISKYISQDNISTQLGRMVEPMGWNETLIPLTGAILIIFIVVWLSIKPQKKELGEIR